MTKERIHKTPQEAKDLGFLNKKELKAIGLMPSKYQNPAASVWQGQSAYSVWDPKDCQPYKYETPRSVIRKRECRDIARQWLSLSPLFLDTETTGLDESAEIIEISLIDIQGEVIFNSLCQSVEAIPFAAFNVHGISDSLLIDKPTWPEIWPSVCAAIQGRPVVIYNADYDVRLIKQTCQRHGLPIVEFEAHCLMRLYSRFYGEKHERHSGYQWQKLTYAIDQCRLPQRSAHRSLSDCLMTLDLLKYVAYGKRKAK